MNKNNLPIYLAIAVVFGILIGTFFSSGSSAGLALGSSKEKKELSYENEINKIEVLVGYTNVYDTLG